MDTIVSKGGFAPTVEPSADQWGIAEERVTVWRTLVRVNARITRHLETTLSDEHDMALATYEVLSQLSMAPDRRLRMTELADKVFLSRSGLTRLIDRLTRDELVTREACVSDARGLFAVLTDKGQQRMLEAAPTYYKGVEELFCSRLTPEQSVALEKLLDSLEK